MLTSQLNTSPHYYINIYLHTPVVQSTLSWTTLPEIMLFFRIFPEFHGCLRQFHVDFVPYPVLLVKCYHPQSTNFLLRWVWGATDKKGLLSRYWVAPSLVIWNSGHHSFIVESLRLPSPFSFSPSKKKKFPVFPLSSTYVDCTAYCYWFLTVFNGLFPSFT